jgi:hypothetical protein
MNELHTSKINNLFIIPKGQVAVFFSQPDARWRFPAEQEPVPEAKNPSNNNLSFNPGMEVSRD